MSDLYVVQTYIIIGHKKIGNKNFKLAILLSFKKVGFETIVNTSKNLVTDATVFLNVGIN